MDAFMGIYGYKYGYFLYLEAFFGYIWVKIWV